MIFLTVGTQFSFDRLVKAVDQAVETGIVTEQVFAQVGESSYQAHNFESVPSLESRLFVKHIHRASYIISHAGIGTIIMALNNNKPLLVMPRQKKYGEVVNDHQIEIAKKFEESGHVLVAYHQEDLPDKIERLRTFAPRKRRAQSQMVANHITQFLNELAV